MGIIDYLRGRLARPAPLARPGFAAEGAAARPVETAAGSGPATAELLRRLSDAVAEDGMEEADFRARVRRRFGCQPERLTADQVERLITELAFGPMPEVHPQLAEGERWARGE
jgi:hypothetical protein